MWSLHRWGSAQNYEWMEYKTVLCTSTFWFLDTRGKMVDWPALLALMAGERA
jgi:hypothetical protein